MVVGIPVWSSWCCLTCFDRGVVCGIVSKNGENGGFRFFSCGIANQSREFYFKSEDRVNKCPRGPFLNDYFAVLIAQISGGGARIDWVITFRKSQTTRWTGFLSISFAAAIITQLNIINKWIEPAVDQVKIPVSSFHPYHYCFRASPSKTASKVFTGRETVNSRFCTSRIASLPNKPCTPSAEWTSPIGICTS